MLRKGASGGQRQFHDVERDGHVVGLQDVVVAYPRSAMARRGDGVRAVDGVSLSIPARGSLGLVGESGCGKTSLGRSIVGLSPLSSGEISLAERAGIRRGRSTRVMHRVARSVQIVLQDPYSSLDPRQSIGSTITEPMRVHGLGSSRDQEDRAAGLLDRVGLSRSLAKSHPHELSGGQRQRVCIARALAVSPLLLICDEPTSALDVSIQAQVVELLQHLQREEDLTLLLITHDLALLPPLVSTVAVMYLGRLVEVGPVATVLRDPRHPYTVSLLSAAPVLGRRRNEAATKLLRGDLPTEKVAEGCPFRSRCWLYRQLDASEARRCADQVPVLHDHDGSSQRVVVCHHQATMVDLSRRHSVYVLGGKGGSPSTGPDGWSQQDRGAN